MKTRPGRFLNLPGFFVFCTPNPFYPTQSHLPDFRAFDATFSNQYKYHQTEQNNLKTHLPIFLNISLLGLCVVACFIPEDIMMRAIETLKIPNLPTCTILAIKNPHSHQKQAILSCRLPKSYPSLKPFAYTSAIYQGNHFFSQSWFSYCLHCCTSSTSS